MPHKISNQSPIYADLTGVFNAIKSNNFESFRRELGKDEQRLNCQYAGGYFGGNNSLLHIAAYNNCIDIAKVLLDKGIELEAKTSSGYTPLMIACVCGYYPMACILLDRGANVDAKEDSNPHPRTCMDLTHSAIKASIIEYLRPKTPPPIVHIVEMTDGTYTELLNMYVSPQL